MSDNNIKSEIINFYNDSLYQELKGYYDKTTIFDILKIERNEKCHSAFLAWLLDIEGSHGLGAEPLMKFMRLLANMDDKYIDPFLNGNYNIKNFFIRTENQVSKQNENEQIIKGSVDIYIEFDYALLIEKEEINDLHHVYIIIENKVYTKEHSEQTKKYIECIDKGKNDTLIGVFWAPDVVESCSGDSNNFQYIKITYENVLRFVIEPLINLSMQQNPKMTILDYMINLEKPVKKRDKNGNLIEQQKDTILAISKTKENDFQKVYEEHSHVLDASLYVKSRNKKHINEFKKVYSNYEDFQQLSENDCNLLESFWNSNNTLLKMIMRSILEKRAISDSGEDLSNKIDVLLDVKKNNRNATKYIVKDKDGNLMNDLDKKAKPAYMSLASYYIFKAWLQDKDNENATLKDIRNAFPVEECAPHYNDTFQYLFYKESDIKQATRNGKTERTYFIAELDEDNAKTKIAHKYLTWDFYMDGKHNLKVKNEENGKDENVLNIKYWTDDEFKKLMGYSKQYGISVEPA